MAVKVEDKGVQALQKFTFLLSYDDECVRKMLVQNGHKIVFNEDQPYDIALFPGGPDIIPFLYGEEFAPHTKCMLKRDLKEINFFKNLPASKPKVGICRGAQLLCVLSGGRLWQHVDGHTSSKDKQGHFIKDTNFYTEHIKVTSSHHQMMIPASNHHVFASACAAMTLYSETDGEFGYDNLIKRRDAGWTDAEIVFSEETQSLCFQPHPEYQENFQSRDLFFKYIDYLFTKQAEDKLAG